MKTQAGRPAPRGEAGRGVVGAVAAIVALLVVLLFGGCALRAEDGTARRWTAAGNFVVDLPGEVFEDDAGNASIWGTRQAWPFPLTFTPPAGMRVRIVRVSGDLTARLTLRGAADAPALPGRYTGVLLALATQHPSQGSVRGDWMADDTLVYAQADIGAAGVVRIPFREDFEDVTNACLGPEHKLWFVAGKYLDETGYATHLEATFSSLVYEWATEASCE